MESQGRGRFDTGEKLWMGKKIMDERKVEGRRKANAIVRAVGFKMREEKTMGERICESGRWGEEYHDR